MKGLWEDIRDTVSMKFFREYFREQMLPEHYMFPERRHLLDRPFKLTWRPKDPLMTYMHYTMHKMDDAWICTHAFMVQGRFSFIVIKPTMNYTMPYPKATFQLPVRREG